MIAWADSRKHLGSDIKTVGSLMTSDHVASRDMDAVCLALEAAWQDY